MPLPFWIRSTYNYFIQSLWLQWHPKRLWLISTLRRNVIYIIQNVLFTTGGIWKMFTFGIPWTGHTQATAIHIHPFISGSVVLKFLSYVTLNSTNCSFIIKLCLNSYSSVQHTINLTGGRSTATDAILEGNWSRLHCLVPSDGSDLGCVNCNLEP